MQISRNFTIAVHMLLLIDFFKTEKATSEFLAGSVGVNPVIIRNILKMLQNYGLVETRLGVGGSTLARAAGAISLFDVYKAVGADKRPVINFHENPNPQCPVGSKIHAVLDGKISAAQLALEENLKATTIAQLAEGL